MKLLLLAILVTFQAQAEPRHRGWTDRDDVSRRSDRAVKRTERFQEHCGGIADVSGFAGGIKQLGQAMRRLQSQLDRGYDGCLSDFKNIRDQYRKLAKEFDERHSHHRDWRVAYAWNSVTLAYVELEWAFTQGETLD